MNGSLEEETRRTTRKAPGAMMVLFLALLTVSGPLVIAAFIWGGRMVGSLALLAISLVFTSLYIYAMRRDG